MPMITMQMSMQVVSVSSRPLSPLWLMTARLVVEVRQALVALQLHLALERLQDELLHLRASATLTSLTPLQQSLVAWP
jgi:hypothetical protein